MFQSSYPTKVVSRCSAGKLVVHRRSESSQKYFINSERSPGYNGHEEPAWKSLLYGERPIERPQVGLKIKMKRR